MFDLFRSRAKAVRLLLGALLVMVALSMVTYLIPGFGTDVSSNDQVVAEVGKEVLTLREVQMNIQNAIRARSLPSEMVPVFAPQMIDQMITERAVEYQAARMGFVVTEADVASAVQMILPQLFEGGKFAGNEVYAAYLAQQNLTIQEFERRLRSQLLIDKLRNLVSEGTVVTPNELESEYHQRNDKVKIEYVAIYPDKLRPLVTVTPEEIQANFNQNRASFQIPEKRSLEMLVIDEAKVGESVTVPEAQLRAAYDGAKDRFRVPERVKVRHILLKTTDKPKEDIPKIRAKAEDLLKQIKGGANFADLAKKNSEDPGSAAKGGDLDWVVRGQTVKAFEDTAFSLKPKEISNIVTTEYGFHILQVMEKQEARLRPFEEVRAELTTELKRQMVFDKMQNMADEARAALQKDPQKAAEIARNMGLSSFRVDKVGAGEPFPEVGVNKEFEDAVASLQKGEVTPVVQAQGNKLLLGVLSDVIPARPAEFAEVQGQIRDRLTDQKVQQLVDQKAREALEKAKALNGDLKKVAQSMGLEFKAPPEFTRSGAVEGIGAATYVAEAFTREAGAVFGPVTVSTQRYICKVAARMPADMSGFPAQRESLLMQVKSRKAQERNDLFEEGLRDQLIREGKVKIHQDVISRLVSSYRG